MSRPGSVTISFLTSTSDRDADGPLGDDVLMANYPTIMWLTLNNNDDGISAFEADMLTDYLDFGGQLVISSAHLPEQLNGHALLTQYLGMQVNHANEASARKCAGVANDAHFDGANIYMGGAPNIPFPDAKMSFTPANGSVAVLNYTDMGGGNSYGVAAIKHETPTYRTLTFGFPIETVKSVSGTESVSDFNMRIWNWINRVPGSALNDEIAPNEFRLEAIYPNPFNSQSVVNFSLPIAGTASLKLFDVAGRQAATLFNGQVPAGNRSVVLNANAIGLQSGVYYVRLEADGRTLNTKALYLK